MNKSSEIFNTWIDCRKTKFEKNFKDSTDTLISQSVEFSRISSNQLSVGNFDYFPATGIFIDRLSKAKGRGVMNLIKKVKSC